MNGSIFLPYFLISHEIFSIEDLQLSSLSVLALFFHVIFFYMFFSEIIDTQRRIPSTMTHIVWSRQQLFAFIAVDLLAANRILTWTLCNSNKKHTELICMRCVFCSMTPEMCCLSVWQLDVLWFVSFVVIRENRLVSAKRTKSL